MRSLLLGIVTTLLFAFGGNVHAENGLDGKALVCVNAGGFTKGLLFANGLVTVYYVGGYEIIKGKSVVYDEGTYTVEWFYIENLTPKTFILNRETLKINYHGDCELSTEGKIRSRLNNVIAKAKKRNKI